jgi:ribosomal protein S18 acetylase RimI-like enzyme
VRSDGDWRILLCTAYEERRLGASSSDEGTSPSGGRPDASSEGAPARDGAGAGPRIGPSLQVRPFQRGDEESVISLWERCGLTRPWNDPRKDIARKLRVQPELFLVGLLDRRVVATAMAGYEGHRGWVNYLAVDPRAQSSGLGTQIMSDVEQRLLELGCPKINVQIRATNSSAVAFYRRLGYAVDEVTSMGKRLERDG